MSDEQPVNDLVDLTDRIQNYLNKVTHASCQSTAWGLLRECVSALLALPIKELEAENKRLKAALENAEFMCQLIVDSAPYEENRSERECAEEIVADIKEALKPIGI